MFVAFFFFNDTATTEIYTLSLHDALPISQVSEYGFVITPYRVVTKGKVTDEIVHLDASQDRKSTRLNSSHPSISYAVFCLKKKKKQKTSTITKYKPQSSSKNKS